MSDETLHPPAPEQAVIRARDLEKLRNADQVLREAEALKVEALKEAEGMKADILAAARDQAVKDSVRAATTVIARAEIEAETRLRKLEPDLARLVSDTVLKVLGSLDDADAVTRATATALHRLRDHRKARIRTAPDVATSVRKAVAETTDGADIVAVEIDERLAPGRTILSSDRGHVEIGLPGLLETAIAPWRDVRGETE